MGGYRLPSFMMNCDMSQLEYCLNLRFSYKFGVKPMASRGILDMHLKYKVR